MEPIDGFRDYKIHSDGYIFDRFGSDDPSSQQIGAAQLSEWIRMDSGYDGGPIRLLACSAGKYEDGAAQRLSDLLGVDVLAPTDKLFVNIDGKTAVAENSRKAAAVFAGRMPDGEWRMFRPRK